MRYFFIEQSRIQRPSRHIETFQSINYHMRNRFFHAGRSVMGGDISRQRRYILAELLDRVG